MKKQFELIATAAAGIEAVVGRELRDLGYDCQVENGRVRFQGDRRAIIETNLWLRAADRVKIVVGTFPAKNLRRTLSRCLCFGLGKLFAFRSTFSYF